MTAPHCFTCRYWLERDIHFGECRRFPPSIVVEAADGLGLFILSRRNDWCGEHQDKHAGREA